VKGSEIRDQISELVPDPSFGTDLRSRMVPCTPPAPPPVPSPAAETKAAPKVESKARECFQMESQLALHRLKQRVEPIFTPQALAYLQNAQSNVTVKVRIEENGTVTVIDASGANALITNAVRTAVGAWKFSPALDDSGPRCVNTDIPVVISRR
jgi:hypothetical protein